MAKMAQIIGVYAATEFNLPSNRELDRVLI